MVDTWSSSQWHFLRPGSSPKLFGYQNQFGILLVTNLILDRNWSENVPWRQRHVICDPEDETKQREAVKSSHDRKAAGTRFRSVAEVLFSNHSVWCSWQDEHRTQKEWWMRRHGAPATSSEWFHWKVLWELWKGNYNGFFFPISFSLWEFPMINI